MSEKSKSPQQKKNNEKGKKKPGFLNKLFFSAGMEREEDKNNEAADKSILNQSYLLKTEGKRAGYLREKLDKQFLEEDLHLYQKELNKILQPKLKRDEWNQIEKLPPLEGIFKVIELLRNKKVLLSKEELQRCYHYLRLIKEIVLLRSEMESNLAIEPYYEVVKGTANLKRLLSHLYILLDELTQKVDQSMEMLIVQYLRDQLVLNKHIHAENMSAQELKDVLQELSEDDKQEILNPQKIDALLKNILSCVGLQVAGQIKSWARESLRRYGLNQSGKELEENGDHPVVSSDRADTAEIVAKPPFEDKSAFFPAEASICEEKEPAEKSLDSAIDEEAALPRVYVELGLNELAQILVKLKGLQQRLELAQLRKDAVAFIHSNFG